MGHTVLALSASFLCPCQSCIKYASPILTDSERGRGAGCLQLHISSSSHLWGRDITHGDVKGAGQWGAGDLSVCYGGKCWSYCGRTSFPGSWPPRFLPRSCWLSLPFCSLAFSFKEAFPFPSLGLEGVRSGQPFSTLCHFSLSCYRVWKLSGKDTFCLRPLDMILGLRGI